MGQDSALHLEIDAIFAATYNEGSNLEFSESPAKVVVGAVAPCPLSGPQEIPRARSKSSNSFKESKHQ
jgi:hypothetical protein